MTGKPAEPLKLARRDPEPYEVGNTAALRHGGYSERAIAERAEEVHAELLRYAPWLDEPQFMPAVQRYLEAAAREALIHSYIEKVCAERGAGAIPVRLWESATSVSRLAARLGDDLGLSPQGRAKIAILSGAAVSAELDVAALQNLAARGAEIRASRADAIEADAEEDES